MQQGKSGVITCHGFTGYSNEMDPIGACFQKNGFAWRNITLPGHCTSPEDLRRYRWSDWTSLVLAEIEAFQPECPQGMVMIGLSMGGLLTPEMMSSASPRPSASLMDTFSTPSGWIFSLNPGDNRLTNQFPI